MTNFHGVEVALLHHDRLLMQLRDSTPGLFNAGMWDFPGGGREGDETPIACAIREIKEECGISLVRADFVWEKTYPAQKDPTMVAYFFVARLSDEKQQGLHFGSEGERWQFMDITEFIAHETVIPALKDRFQDYLKQVR